MVLSKVRILQKNFTQTTLNFRKEAAIRNSRKIFEGTLAGLNELQADLMRMTFIAGKNSRQKAMMAMNGGQILPRGLHMRSLNDQSKMYVCDPYRRCKYLFPS